jgi:RecJ-like exonuclease
MTKEQKMKFEQCPDCSGRGHTEYRPTCQLCGLIEGEPHEHAVERSTCTTCHGAGTLSGLALAVRKARGGPPPPPVQRGFA